MFLVFLWGNSLINACVLQSYAFERLPGVTFLIKRKDIGARQTWIHTVVVWMRLALQTPMFGYLVSSGRSCLRRIKVYDLTEGGMLPGPGFEVSKDLGQFPVYPFCLCLWNKMWVFICSCCRVLFCHYSWTFSLGPPAHK